ncbi:hypothetical protein WJX72_003340 [[Myrmecia] bisecta]|uniref:Uncharacterized protein n=1 Tax=[Myrmecia] bisecta TaxID=41462 RepID=A0AAW1QPY3_9CHLO
MIEEVCRDRRLSHRTKADLQRSLAEGSTQWVSLLKDQCTRSPLKPKSKTCGVAVPRVGLNKHAGQLSPPLARPAGRKALQDVLRDSPSERDRFAGAAPGVDREAEKDRLALTFELGREGMQARQQAASTAQSLHQSQRAMQSADQHVDPKEALIDQIVAEIQERREFLESARQQGQPSPCEARLKAEISSRLAELRRLGVSQ